MIFSRRRSILFTKSFPPSSERGLQSSQKYGWRIFSSLFSPIRNIAYFNKIVQRHLDFLICDAATMKPLLGIELDDSSHQWNQRQERDKFIEEVFEAAQFPLLRFPVQREYNAREIVARLAPALKNKLESSPPSPQLHTSSERNAAPPLCPKCGVPMVLRTVTQGEHKGKQFYGCPNFPKCREVKPASDSAPS